MNFRDIILSFFICAILQLYIGLSQPNGDHASRDPDTARPLFQRQTSTDRSDIEQDLELNIMLKYSTFVEKVKQLQLHGSKEGGWVFVPSNKWSVEDIIKETGQGVGGVAMSGDWKIHISIDPSHMQKAIPIVLHHLYPPIQAKGIPQLAMKLQVAGQLADTHQQGKEVAVIFSEDDEKHNIDGIKEVLLRLSRDLEAQDVRPEQGLLATEANEAHIRSHADKYPQEIENYKGGKYDATFPQRHGFEYFNYRSESAIIIVEEDFAKELAPSDPRIVWKGNLQAGQKHNGLNQNDFFATFNFAN